MGDLEDVTVLVIDEHDDVRAPLTRRLQASPPLRIVASTGSALEGIHLAEKWQPDIILADLRWRNPYSAEVYSRIARAGGRARLVVYTSYLTPEEEEAARLAGACVCLLKGMSVKELAARLADIARRRPPVGGPLPA